ncbi:hypothetical protein P691DRAFT_774852 [Macrolepiota fuliginosa MF-IS2]|uniref:Uncharacterized protein n=1 Tax=Macrolepiota fuliginosa MF-IS2 TaxID=1400762 RepID=A0A9P5XDV0_9AGAR|nr:hypothetical protein P691DRAFT_774852 [Macrolepiota fuliginosa MF-IS2]
MFLSRNQWSTVVKPRPNINNKEQCHEIIHPSYRQAQMSMQAEAEAVPRVSTDTIIGEQPPSPKSEALPLLEPTREPSVRGNDVHSGVASPMTVSHSPLRLDTPPENQRVEWNHIRTQLGMAPEERRVDWDRVRDQLGLSEDDEESISLLKQIAQACLVLATTPFMLLHGVFKMLGALCRSLGMIFTGLAKLASKLTYRPGKKRDRQDGAGPIQI